MCSGISLAISEIPIAIIERHQLQDRIFGRGGESEVRFFFGDSVKCIPIFHEGKFQIVRWGSTRSESRTLPTGGWIMTSFLKSHAWGDVVKTPVIIPATMGVEKGIWFRIRQGIHGILVRNEKRNIVVYMLCEQSSHYYQVMTRSTRMPVLIDEKF